MKKQTVIFSYIFVGFFGLFSAFNYALFVFPNSFAPSGIDGICTMIQYLFNFNMGYLALLVNIPLLLVAWKLLSREFTLKTGVYTIVFSLSTILLKQIDLSKFAYYTDTGTSTVLAPIVAGVIRGLLYAVTLKCNGSSGGVDIIAAIVHKYKPHYNLMNIIFVLNLFVAFASYFVYNFKPEPVICSILYMFLTSAVSKAIQASKEETIKFEIITADAQTLCDTISERLQQTATVVNAHGAHSGSDKKMVICVTKKKKVPQLENLLHEFPDAVAFESVVNHSIFGHR